MHLTDSVPSAGDSFPDSERRQHSRQLPKSLLYVHLDESNGGILLNVGEGGLAVQAAMSVMEDSLPHVRLQVAHSKKYLEASARVIWTGDSRRTVGIEFLDFADEDSRKQLRDWINAEAGGHTIETHVTVSNETHAVQDHHVSEHHLPLDHHVPVKSVHTAAVLPHHSADFDISIMPVISVPSDLAQRPVTPAMSRSVAALPETVMAEPHEPVAVRPAKTKKPATKGRYTPVLVSLASLSLLAGWAAGRGNFAQFFSGLFEPSSAATVSAADASASRVANLATASFLVIDSGNQSWLVPFVGPTIIPQGAPTPPLPPQPVAVAAPPPAPVRKPSFQQWTLSAPQSTGRRSTIQNAAPAPELPAAATGANALSAALANSSGILPPSSSTFSNLVGASVLRRVDPIYPKAALEERVGGPVKIHAHIAEDGSVNTVTAVSGSPLLIPAAVAAVKKWQYKPELLDGHPVVSETDVTIVFSLPQ
jgi:TonB family protein